MKHKTNKTCRARRPLVTVLTVILAVFAVLVFLFRDDLNAEMIQRLTGRENASWADGEAFSYESGGEQVFALSGDGLAAASVTGLQLLNDDGETVARQVFSMDQPSVAASPVLCAFFDVGGTALRTATPDGTITNLDTEEAIISVSVNEKGYLAVTTEEQGYKGCVTVYSPELEPLYRWHAGTGYTLSARVSPNGSRLVVNCLTETGGELRFFSLDSETQQAAFTVDGIVLDFEFLDNDTISAICEEKLVILDGDGKETGHYNYNGMYLTDYIFSSDVTILLLSHFRTGNTGMLVNVDARGRPFGSADTEGEILSISENGGDLLVLQSGAMTLFDSSLNTKNVFNCPLGIRQALLRSGGEALLLTGYGAKLYRLS